MEKSARTKSYTMGNAMLFSFGIFQLIFPLIATYKQPRIMLSSDFLMDFYPAGKLIMQKRAAELYHLADNLPFTESAFNRFVHQILPDLPKEQVAIYMYSPLTAAIFSPFSLLNPQTALMLWQSLSVSAFILSIFFISKGCNESFKRCFGYSLLYLAVFHTILIGQLGIVLGLLPLAVGYFFLMRRNLFVAGFFWSVTLLKPQFLPIPLLVSVTLLLNKKYSCVFGFCLGIAAFAMTTICCLEPSLLVQWISSFKTSDTIFSDPHYSYPRYLITSLPAVILHFFPISSRNLVKIPAYIFSLLLSLHALWFSTKLLKRNSDNLNSALTSVFVVGIAILPLILPHFLLYDFSVFAFFAVLFRSSLWQGKQHLKLKIMDWLYLISLDIYCLLCLTPIHYFLQPTVFVLIMTYLYYRLLKTLQTA